MPQGVIGRVSLTRGGWSTGEMLRDLRVLWAKQGLLNTTAIYPLAHRARSVGPKSRSRRFGNAQIDQRHARTPLAQLWPWLLFRRVSLHPSRSTLNSCSVSRIAWLFLFGVSLTAQRSCQINRISQLVSVHFMLLFPSKPAFGKSFAIGD